MNASPRIVFAIMSAVSRPSTVDQLARSLLPHHVLVHHDFSQQPRFALTSPNVEFVPNPKRTGWAVWGFTEAIFHSLQYAVDAVDFDYFQLLSPSCLPIKPMAAFRAHVERDEADAHFGWLDVLGDRDVLMTVGYRAFSPERTLRHRILRRLCRVFFGKNPGRRNEAGIWLHSGYDRNARGEMTLSARLALQLSQLMANPKIGGHIFDESLHPYCGSAWFGARRPIAEKVVREFSRPEIQRYFSGLRISEEFLIPTLLKLTCAVAGPSNHFISEFDEANPRCLTEEDFHLLVQSEAFFARKFPDDPEASIRQRVLAELVGSGAP